MGRGLPVDTRNPNPTGPPVLDDRQHERLTMSDTIQSHTIDEALAKFDLIAGKGDGRKTACVMSAISWVAGEAFTDTPSCAHRLLRALTINANDADDTTPEDRAAILRAGEHGLLDTWWVPDEVIAAAMSAGKVTEGEEPPEDQRSPVQRVLDVLGAVAWWKEDKQRADLRYADLGYADLGSADLGSADLGSANLRYADLRYANLRSANLRSADLRSADLGSADLRSADLRSANLGYANLGYADLRYANLRSANLRSARNFGEALNVTTAYGNEYTVLPAGWSVDEDTGLVVKDGEA